MNVPRGEAVSSALVSDLRLANRMRLVTAARRLVPLAEVRLRIPLGSTSTSRPGLALVVSELLLTSPAHPMLADLVSACDELGARLTAHHDSECVLISATVLAQSLKPLLELIANGVQTPHYTLNNLSHWQRRMSKKLQISASSITSSADEGIWDLLCGHLPHGSSRLSAADLATLSPSEAESFHSEYIRPDEASIIVVGDIDSSTAAEQVGDAFAGWVPSYRVAAHPDTSSTATSPVMHHKELRFTATQRAEVRLGRRAPRRADLDYAAFLLANVVLGGYYSSRLMRRLREDRAYVYGLHARVRHRSSLSALIIDLSTSSSLLPIVLGETRRELSRVSTDSPITPTELDAAKQYVVGANRIATSSQQGLAASLSSIVGGGMQPSWLNDHHDEILAAPLESVRDAAATYLCPESFCQLIAGDLGQPRSGQSACEPDADTRR